MIPNDADDRLTRDILDYYRHLCTDLEADTLRACNLTVKAEHSSVPAIANKLREASELTSRPEIRVALEDGVAVARKRIRDRLMQDNKDAIRLNCCPKCSELCRTPQAQMCIHCGHSRHH